MKSPQTVNGPMPNDPAVTNPPRCVPLLVTWQPEHELARDDRLDLHQVAPRRTP